MINWSCCYQKIRNLTILVSKRFMGFYFGSCGNHVKVWHSHPYRTKAPPYYSQHFYFSVRMYVIGGKFPWKLCKWIRSLLHQNRSKNNPTNISDFWLKKMFLGGCDGSTSLNNSYFTSSSGDTSPCSYTVCKSG